MHQVAATIDAVVNPFRGLAQYQRDDPLFARDKDVELIESRLWSSRVTVMFAGSGVGKSSFLNAKLIPSLEQIFQPQHVAVPDANSWARVDPRAALIAAREQVTSGKPTRRGGIIILDQFEEVFQHFPTPLLLRGFGQELSAIADEDAGLNVRLLISIREEFLADLTSLDDYLPGVLTNYYRLRRLTTKQARLIIENTARLSGVETSPRVEDLIQDLCALDRGQRRHAGIFVDPPYLQIVCQRVWNRESPGPERPFLSSYAPREAERELEAYCREKLARLSPRQASLVRRALEHLTGPHEAKKFGRVTELAREIRSDNPEALARALDVLAGPEVRILRRWEESAASDWAQQNAGRPRQVYQLYHDMYAPMLWRWKEEQERRARWTSLALGVVAAAALVFFALWPLAQRMVVTRPVNLPAYGNVDEFSAVLNMRNAFGRTLFLRPFGDMSWRHYAAKLATLSALQQDMAGALTYRLAALSTMGRRPGPDDVRGAMGPGAYLAGTLTGLTAVTDAVFLENAGGPPKVLMGTTDGWLVEWTPGQGKTSRRLMVDRDGADAGGAASVNVLCLSPDGSRALAVIADGDRPDKSGSGVRVGTFSTGTAKLIGQPLQLPAHPGAAAGGHLAGAMLEAGAAGFGAAGAPTEIQGSYDASGQRFAVVTGDTAMVYDGAQPWTIAERGIRRLTFTGNVVVTAAETYPGASSWQLAFWRMDPKGGGVRIPLATPAVLPWSSQLVLDARGRVLAISGNQWQWISTDSPAEPQELPFAADRWGISAGPSLDPDSAAAPPMIDQRGGPPPSRFSPQAYDAANDMLLFMDDHGLFAFVHPSETPDLYRVLPITEQRWDAGLTRQLTSASLSAFSRRRVISIDDLGTAVRLWRVPTASEPAVDLAASGTDTGGTATSTACPQDEPQSQETFCSVGNEWAASVPRSAPYEVRVEYRGTAARSPGNWSVAADVRPRGVLVGADGSRILLLFDDEVRYVEKGRTVVVHPIRRSVRDAVFGPGPRRVTLMTAEDIMIFGPGHWDSENGEWQAPCLTNAAWLLRKKDEQSVVLYSRFWMHTLRENSSAWERWMSKLTREGRVWPDVTSVLTDAPISRRQFVEAGDDVQLFQNGRRVDGPEGAFDAVTAFDGGFSPVQWLATLTVQPCSRAGAGSEGGWQQQWCQWERTLGRRAGLPLTH